MCTPKLEKSCICTVTTCFLFLFLNLSCNFSCLFLRIFFSNIVKSKVFAVHENLLLEGMVPDTTVTMMESVFANMDGHYIYNKGKCPCYSGRTLHSFGWDVSFLINPDTTFIMKVSVFAIRAKYQDWLDGKFTFYYGWTQTCKMSQSTPSRIV